MTDKAFNESINEVGLEHFNNSIPLIRGDFVQSMITALSRRGLDPKPIFKSSKLDPNLVKESKMVAIHPARQFFKAAYDAMPTETFSYGIQYAIRHLLVPEFTKNLPSQFTVREVLTRFNILIRDSAPVASQYLVEDDNEAWFCRAEGPLKMEEWEEVFTAIYAVELIRNLIRMPSWSPKHVYLRQGPDSSFIKFVPQHIQVLYGQDEHKVEVDKAILDKTISISESANKRDQIEWHSTFSDTVYTALLPMCMSMNLL